MTTEMNLAKIQEIQKSYANPVQVSKPVMLTDLKRYRGIGPEYVVYNRMTALEGCAFLIQHLEFPFPPEIVMDQNITSSWTIDGKAGTQIQNGYSVGTVRVAKLVDLISTALRRR